MSLTQSLQRAGSRLLHLLAPRCCAACAAPLPLPRELFCEVCESVASAETGSAGLTAQHWGLPVVALGRYRPPLSVGIRNFKYSGRSDLAGPFSRALWQHAGNAFDQGVIFVPVPLHPKRLCERGYNQAALLARGLARWASSTTSVTALRRTTHTAKQARLTRAEREHNVQHTMQASPGCGQQRIVLVDDVLTTGATLVECVRALHDAGARVAGACVLAVAGQDQDADA